MLNGFYNICVLFYNMNLKNIKINKQIFKIYFKKGVFEPTGTTTFLINAILSKNKNIINKNILDLGCGSGVISIYMNSKFPKNLFYASDLNKRSIESTIKNFKKYKLNGQVKKGSLLKPWENCKFDFIINDISGISSIIAQKSKWFKNVPAESGLDGTNLTIKVLETSKNYLSKNGKLYLPLISLSNTKKVINIAKKKFKNVKTVSNDEWFLPNDLEKNSKLLFKLKKNKKIDFKFKFGKFICFTKVLELKN